jgi:hypothetical protein
MGTASAALALTFLTGWLSYRFVELRFHRPPSAGRVAKVATRPGRIAFRGVVAMLAATALGFGLTTVTAAPLNALYPADQLALDQATQWSTYPKPCQTSPHAAVSRPSCFMGDHRRNPANLVLWGDSLSDALRGGLQPALKNRSGYAFILHSCPAILDTRRIDERPEYRTFWRRCQKYTNQAAQLLAERKDLDTVILISNYQTAVDRPGVNVRLVPDPYPPGSDRTGLIADDIAKTAAFLRDHGKTVVVVGTYYTADELGAQYLDRVRMADRNAMAQATVPLATYDRYTSQINNRLRTVPGVIYVDPKPLFCPPGGSACNYAPGLPLLIDRDHLTPAGAARLAGMIDQALQRAGQKGL